MKRSGNYNQRRALWAITKASFRAIFRNPSAIVFSILFPIIFIMIFGSFGEGGPSKIKVAFSNSTDTTSAVYDSMKTDPMIRVISYLKNGVVDTARRNDDLQKGKLDAVVDIRQLRDSGADPHYLIYYHSTTASGPAIVLLEQEFDHLTLKMEKAMAGANYDHFTVIPSVEQVREYRAIDFVLPGQLGFSILFSTLFGIAFTFFNLRETLVLKRFYASPVNRFNILTGIGISRLFFQLVNVIVLILVGHYFLNFTLQNGIITFLEMLVMTTYMLFILMGVGLIFSSIVKTDTSIPLLINLFGFPQMLLSGTFFPIEVFPGWLQVICKLLPLTQFNDAMRKISFEGAHLLDCGREIGILAIWGILIYILTIRTFKWE